MAIETATFLVDTIFYIKNQLLSNITDPIVTTRPAGQVFVLTAYPKRPVVYPIITVVDDSINDESLGQGSEQRRVTITLEVRIWGRNAKERDQLSQNVYNHFRDIELTASTGTAASNLHAFKIISMVNVPEGGERGTQSKKIMLQYYAIVG